MGKIIDRLLRIPNCTSERAWIVIGVVAAGAQIAVLIAVITMHQRKKRQEFQKARMQAKMSGSLQQQFGNGVVIL